jgi:hypothetical protein
MKNLILTFVSIFSAVAIVSAQDSMMKKETMMKKSSEAQVVALEQTKGAFTQET